MNSAANPNLGKMPVSKRFYDYLAESVPSALADVYNYEDQQAELLWRLNARLQGKDPGVPVNWRGL